MDRVIVFVKWPEPGRAKTRLIPALGPKGAAELHDKMARRTLSSVRQGAKRAGCSVEVRSSGAVTERFRGWLGDDLSIVDQGGGDLGDRMALSVSDAIDRGVEKVLLLGTDCPDIDPSFIHHAMTLLKGHPIVMGPASDGGYYCLGIDLSRAGKRALGLFRGVPWSSSATGQATLDRARSLGLEVGRLPILSDVDRPEDLEIWGRACQKISVIIPTLNERDGISICIRSALGAQDVEVIVSDGGSTDGTIEVAESYGAQVVRSPKGRGTQMNAGATAAEGDILLFLHGDSILPWGYGRLVREALSDKTLSLGAFSLRIGLPGELKDPEFRSSMNTISFWANVRSRWLSLPYGDQGFFMGKSLFNRLGGFPEMPLLEDVSLVRSASKVGRIGTISATIRTSSRRWRKLGAARTSIRNSMIMLAWAMGVPSSRLAVWYRSRSK
nr:TIGR04283 family arsenosugar biosynthesis glycosyltransferase [uncultured Dethiosulfovibrio sp.]